MTAVSKIYDYPVVMKRYNDKPYLAGEDIELNIPLIKFTEGPTGIVMGESSTCFPVSIARGATWDIQLEEKVGEAMGIEGRALGAKHFAANSIENSRFKVNVKLDDRTHKEIYLQHFKECKELKRNLVMI